MGLYAFAAPWVTMQFPGEYNDHARRLIRLAHVDCVVLGLIAIYIAREIEEVKSRWMPRTVKLLLLFGSISMVGLPLLFAVTGLSIATLNIGPAFIVAAIMLCIQTSPARIADVSWGGKS